MAKRLQEILEDFGLNRREARVYLAVLQHPESSLAEISRRTLIPRMSCYTILKNLLQKGYVDTLIKKRRRHFVAVHPSKILSRWVRRNEELKEALPRFERLSRVSSVTPHVLFFEGTEGIRTVFRRILEEKRPFVALTSIEDMERVARSYFAEFIQRRIRQRLRVRLLTNRTKAALRLKKTDAKELRETRFVPPSCVFHTAEYVFGNTTAILSFREIPPVALLIEDPEIAKTHAMYFDLLWQHAETQ